MPYDQIASTWKLYSEIDLSWSHHDCITLDLHIRGHWPQGHCLQWVLTSATAGAVVLITIVECSGDQPRSSDSGCRIWGLTILWYDNHTCVLGTYCMVWHGILACTWSPLTIASLARNWFWDGNCNCLLCLCTPLPTPSTHIRYMYQFDKHFNQIWRKNFEAWLNIPPLTENTGHHMP